MIHSDHAGRKMPEGDGTLRPGFRNPLDVRLGYQLRRASVAVMADLAGRLGPIGLRPTEATILMVVDANPAITQSDIGRMLGIKRANMAPLTASLCKRGLVERVPADGRSHALRLSREGKRLAAAIGRCIEENEAQAFRLLSDEARGAFAASLPALWADRPISG